MLGFTYRPELCGGSRASLRARLESSKAQGDMRSCSKASFDRERPTTDAHEVSHKRKLKIDNRREQILLESLWTSDYLVL